MAFYCIRMIAHRTASDAGVSLPTFYVFMYSSVLELKILMRIQTYIFFISLVVAFDLNRQFCCMPFIRVVIVVELCVVRVCIFWIHVCVCDCVCVCLFPHVCRAKTFGFGVLCVSVILNYIESPLSWTLHFPFCSHQLPACINKCLLTLILVRRFFYILFRFHSVSFFLLNFWVYSR